jgi:predicted component of type VI protein secretion system
MVVRFHVVSPAAKQRTFTVRLPILLGRGEEAKFRIQHDLVSRKHCEFFERHGQVFVRDLGSTNGTFLNDEQVPVSTKTSVPPGAVVRVGGLSFKVEYETPSGGDSTATVETHEQSDSLTVGESRVQTSDISLSALKESADFHIDHSQQIDEAPVAAGFAPDAANPADAAASVQAADEAAGLPSAAELAEEASPAGIFPEPRGEESPAAQPDEAGAFAFLAGDEQAGPPATTADWPSPDTAAAADDAPDDDQLNAFFKGMK